MSAKSKNPALLSSFFLPLLFEVEGGRKRELREGPHCSGAAAAACLLMQGAGGVLVPVLLLLLLRTWLRAACLLLRCSEGVHVWNCRRESLE